MPDDATPLSFEALKRAVRGSAAAVRLRVALQPAGGTGAKVFPPTYIGGVYVTEERQLGGRPVKCVLLDSVQSQANRLEQALLQAYRDGKLTFPLMSVEFPEFPDIGAVTTLDAPHRIFDAILRDSSLNNVPFRPQVRAKADEPAAEPRAAQSRKQPAAEAAASPPADRVSAEGSRVAMANVRFATPLYELCPTALVFGAWDSTGAAGGLGNKFARAIVSEIIGVNAVPGERPASRLDPLGIEKGEIFEAEADASYVVDPADAKKNEDGTPKVFKRKKEDKGRPSEINHSNVPPDVVRSKDTGEPVGGGVTFDFAEQTTVLSLAALRRLRFPLEAGKPSGGDADHAARTVLAALALAAVAHQIDPPDYFLRSNCQLVLADDPVFELVATATRTDKFTLTAAQADELFAQAVREATAAGLPWREELVTLTPKKALVDLVRRSRELGGGEE